jgi:hypothetical protein
MIVADAREHILILLEDNMDVRDILFPNYPRFVGNPKAFIINNRDELNRFASVNSSDNDKNFCSTCSYYNNIPVFEDIFLETDDILPEPVRKVVLWYEAHHIPWICLHSGSRGFHLHGLFESAIINQNTLKNLARMILKETDTEELFDPHVTGDLRRLCRIPNTQRIGNGWCVPITREELFTLNTPEEFKRLCVSPRFINFTIGKRPSVFDFVKEDVSIPEPIQSVEIAPPKEIFSLKQILRPCVYDNIRTPNPKHNYRVSFVVECLNHGLTNSQIFTVLEKLNWIDFDHFKTHYQIEKIEEKRNNREMLYPYGKVKMGCEKKISCFQCYIDKA